jgi:hypothetical protein
LARPERPWIVTPHDPIEKLEDNLWAVEGGVPGVPMRRRMSIVKRSDGKLLFFHALPLEEAALSQVRAWGQPGYLVVGHDNHAVDAPAFSKMLGIPIYGPKANAAKLSKKIALAGTLEELPPDPAVTVESVPGARNGESLVTVRSAGGQRASLLFCDAVQNMRTGNLLMRLLGFVGGPKCPALFKLLFANDKPALRAGFERMAATPGLVRLVPCHGAIFTDDAAGAMKRIAESV